ncbi:hypothetical protein HMPREF3213_01414 [Heyndrickxia coagulans]|uniref:Uncharacterized protein n=1 Tax=Heyndrickxia coagulans TaxID=1398 RepID=A0A133KUE1_HEYCO|nr:hypothetical protein HMPREF3213_01414 [Heyndrickxia coagulans]
MLRKTFDFAGYLNKFRYFCRFHWKKVQSFPIKCRNGVPL